MPTEKKELINVSKQDLINLKRKYTNATKDGAIVVEKFIWKDREILTAYAKYLIQFLESKFN